MATKRPGRAWIRPLRLGCGLVLYFYLLTHFTNHALGLISLDAMASGREWFLALWRNSLGTVALYGALIVHWLLGLWLIYRRRTLRMPVWEATQIFLGLAVPPLLASHVVGTRLANSLFGVEDSYTRLLLTFWVVNPWASFRQSVLLLIAWIHGCIGLHFWLRLRPWYRRSFAVILSAWVLVPVLAWLGFAEAGHHVATLARDPGFAQRVMAESHMPLAQARARLQEIETRLVRTTWILLAATLRAGSTRRCPSAGRCSKRAAPPAFRMRPSAGDAAAAPPAASAWPETPWRFPRGARRRSACCSGSARHLHQRSDGEIAVLFADLRGFTRLAEHKLPYDVVFFLNRYFEAVGRAIAAAGGIANQYTGDGVMALFGVESGPELACRQALQASSAMIARVEELGRSFGAELGEPLRLGVGIHTGPAVVGEMGYGETRYLTAVGDTVHVASRLEALTKEYHCDLVVSEQVMTRAGVDGRAYPRHELTVRNREAPLRIVVVDDARRLPLAAVTMEERT